MFLRAEDFPIYILMQQQASPGAERAREHFEAAQKGDLQAAYGFAMGMQQLVTMRNIEYGLPGCTEEVKKKTMTGIRNLIEQLARHKHHGATLVAINYAVQGIGGARDMPSAAKWAVQAEALGYGVQLRDMLSPADYDEIVKITRREPPRRWGGFNPN